MNRNGHGAPKKCGDYGHTNAFGEPCKNWPIKGGTVCRNHGGSAPQVRAAANRRLKEWAAQQAVITYGLPRDIDPHSALLEELHRTAGHVSWLAALVAELEATELKQLDTTGMFERASVWLEIYERERTHYARVAKAAIDAGIEERRVRLAEAHGEQLGQVIRAILGDVFILLAKIVALLAAAGVAAEILRQVDDLIRRIQREDVPDVVRTRLMEMAELNP